MTMGILIMDGFDFGGTEEILHKWNTGAGLNTEGTLVAGLGPFGGQCWENDPIPQSRKRFAQQLASGVSNIKTLLYMFEVASGGGAGMERIIIYENRGGAAAKHLTLRIDDTQELFILRGTTPELGRSSAGNANGGKISVASWYHLECRFEISNSIAASGCQVFVDGELWIDLPAGTDTRNAGTTGLCDLVVFGADATVTTARYRMDDIVLVDEEGPVSTAKLFGRHIIETANLISTGATNDFAVVGGPTSSVSAVNSSTRDGDVTHIAASTVGDTELFVASALSADQNTEVFGIQINTYARKSDVFPKTYNHVVVASGTSALPFIMSADKALTLGNSTGPLDSAAYAYNRDIFVSNPAGAGVQWVISEVEAAQYGLVIT